jgi:hypothetical protein
MKKFFVSMDLVASAGIVDAACPENTKYGCIQMPNGKMSCGCR